MLPVDFLIVIQNDIFVVLEGGVLVTASIALFNPGSSATNPFIFKILESLGLDAFAIFKPVGVLVALDLENKLPGFVETAEPVLVFVDLALNGLNLLFNALEFFVLFSLEFLLSFFLFLSTVFVLSVLVNESD
jgi:hypothetical protein